MQLFRVERWGKGPLSLQQSRIELFSQSLARYSSYSEASDFTELPRKRRIVTKSTRATKSTLPSRSRPPTSLAVPAPTYIPNRLRADKKSQDDMVVGNVSDQPLSASGSNSRRSAKLAALHARLSLPSKIPLKSLARTLVDVTAEPDPHVNNLSLATLGNDLTEYYMSEYLLCKYPRLPIAVLYAAQSAYVGVEALNNVVKEWGVEAAAEPGPEVDPGLLQFQWAPIGTQVIERAIPNNRDAVIKGPGTMVPRIVQYPRSGNVKRDDLLEDGTTTLQSAAASFFQAVLAVVSLHSGASAGYKFFSNHVLSRHLDVSSLFTFTHPLKDLARLCAREGFEPPVARIISETGRLSVSPVFVVGIFSGNNLLGEGAGSGLTEARFKACLHALKCWYLYSPAGELILPSQVEGDSGKHRKYKSAYIDQGEVVL